jgi:hypothetical protein
LSLNLNNVQSGKPRDECHPGQWKIGRFGGLKKQVAALDRNNEYEPMQDTVDFQTAKAILINLNSITRMKR